MLYDKDRSALSRPGLHNIVSAIQPKNSKADINNGNESARIPRRISKAKKPTRLSKNGGIVSSIGNAGSKSLMLFEYRNSTKAASKEKT